LSPEERRRFRPSAHRPQLISKLFVKVESAPSRSRGDLRLLV
jgi:hypothetical protein